MSYLTNQQVKELEKNAIQDKYRLNYHLMPPTGWLNDPNGLCQHNGIYHIYYQYSPDNCKGGQKYWGHYTTKDFITYTNESVALSPDHRLDKNGVYSGSAFVKDNQIHFFYTGNVKLEGEHDYIHSGREHNTVLVTSKDGTHMSEKECVFFNKDYPSDLTCHVRDPQIIKKDNDYYMILGARQNDDVGCCLLYKSNDLKSWQYSNRIISKQPFGYMWECPNLVELNNQMIMLCCPQGVEQDGYKYESLYQNGYYLINGDIEKDYELSEFVELDYGFDFYAPQLFKDEQDRIILIGWMGLPDVPYTNPTTQYNWQHALTLPRQLTFKNNHLYQYPIDEIKELRSLEKSFTLNQPLVIDNSCFELHLNIQDKAFELCLREDVQISYQDHLFTFTIGKSGYGRDVRHIEVKSIEDITIFSDTSSLEIFINQGEYSLTTRIYDNCREVTVKSNVEIKGKYYILNSVKVSR